MRLTDRQQERYARHILLDGIGGDGQETLLSSRVRVRGTGSAARACASYLAASGIGALLVDAALGRELCALSPDLRLLDRDEGVDLDLSPADPPGVGPAAAAAAGCWMGGRGSRARGSPVILESLALAVGNTPLVRLSALERESPGVELWAKLEWCNPGGSVKDRAALGIIRDALARGLVGPGTGRTLIDSTSGNTGIAYAWIGAALGVPVALVMPENVSPARKRIARAFGAETIFSDPLEQSDGAIRLCRKLVAEAPDRFFHADQYSNAANPRAHEETTAKEIWRATEGRVTHFVAGIGTSGTAMGTGRGLKGFSRSVQIVGVEPAEALHGLEGLKHMPSSIVPPIYREAELDRKLSVATDEGWDMAERLLTEEGLLAGHSAGAAACGALVVARELSARQESGVVVAIFPDRADRYLTEAP